MPWTWGAALLAGAWQAANLVSFASHTHDDVYISLRYADHLAAGAGFVFNPGERVEGASNALWVFILAGARMAGLDPLTTAKWLGAILVLTIPWLEFRFAGRMSAGRAGATAAWLTVMSPAMAFWAVNGMETGAYAFLVTLSLLLAAGDLQRSAGWPRAVPAFCAASLMRPEGMLLAMPYLFLLTWRARSGKVSWRKTIWASAGLLGCAGATAAARWLYFGVPVPNTFFVKVEQQALWSTGSGLAYLVHYGRDSGAFVWVPLALGSALAAVRESGHPATLLAGALACQIAFIQLTGGDWMPAGRFIVPVLPAAHLLAGDGAARLWRAWGRGRKEASVAVAAMLAGGALTFGLAVRERAIVVPIARAYTRGLE
ncbi:MAG: hypothetical protein AAB368_08510, partial [bacterium]